MAPEIASGFGDDRPPPAPPPPPRPRQLILCLSGGGFRATLFHLGVVRYLAATKELQRVSDIFSVSGGSILAAHLAQRWDDYKDEKTFDKAADALRRFIESDVRGRIVRSWLLAWTCGGLPIWWSELRREQLLVHQYRCLFGQDQANLDLSKLNGPRVHLLTTSLTTGFLCEFSREGFLRHDPNSSSGPVQRPQFDIPFAVAASSAFPPLFPPLPVDAQKMNISRSDFGVDVDHLSDGGVHDNLGVNAALNLVRNRGWCWDGDILISDASASFDWQTRATLWSSFRNIVGRSVRSTDVLMRRVGELQIELERSEISNARLRVSRRMAEVEIDLKRDVGLAGGEAHAVEVARFKENLKSERRRLSEFRVPIMRVIHIDGTRDESERGIVGDLPPHFDAYEGRWDPVRRAPRSPDRSSWARAMATMRTDLDRFSPKEQKFLEAWGYKQASETWSPPSDWGPLGARPSEFVAPPTNDEIRVLQKGAIRKLRLFVPRELAGYFLILVWVVLFSILAIAGLKLAAALYSVHGPTSRSQLPVKRLNFTNPLLPNPGGDSHGPKCGESVTRGASIRTILSGD